MFLRCYLKMNLNNHASNKLHAAHGDSGQHLLLDPKKRKVSRSTVKGHFLQLAFGSLNFSKQYSDLWVILPWRNFMFIVLSHNRFSAIFGAAQVPKNQMALGLEEGVTHVDVHFNWLWLYEDLVLQLLESNTCFWATPLKRQKHKLFLQILLFLHPNPLCDTSLLY